MNRAPIRSILIAGDGIVGRSAALAFARALPGVAVTLLSLPGEPASVADSFAATLPQVGRFHAAIGFDEAELVSGEVAVHHLGTRFERAGAPDWTHSFGEVGRGEGAVPFRQIWLAARKAGEALDFAAYSPASVLGAAGKFVHPPADPGSPLSALRYGLRLNASRYRELLDRATAQMRRVAGPIASIEHRPDGAIAALRLADGTRVEADLFVDCSGPAALLIGALGSEIEDWSQWLPARHLLVEWEDPGPLAPLDEVVAIDRGWRLTASVPGATLRASATTDARSGSSEIRPGRRRESFVRNVLALGDSAVALDPLHGANLSLAHGAILRAIELIPGRDFHPVELAEYNRLTALETDRARDFHALFQADLAKAPPPATLARTLTQWRARGRLPFFEEEIFDESSWAQMLIGLGILPGAVAPLARSIDARAAAPAMVRFADQLDALARRLPPYAEYRARMARR